MKVGTICKLKVDCLGNKAGTLGVVFYDYGDGFQAIFENGNYDGFSTVEIGANVGKPGPVEADIFLEEVGFEESLAGYKFSTVMRVGMDYRKGLFKRAWSIFWQKAAEQIEQAEAKAEPTEYEKCKVYADGNKPPWLRFKRKNREGEGVTVCMLSAAKDYVDFSHFEYADLGKSLESRAVRDDKTIYPLYVVFRKNL